MMLLDDAMGVSSRVNAHHSRGNEAVRLAFIAGTRAIHRIILVAPNYELMGRSVLVGLEIVSSIELFNPHDLQCDKERLPRQGNG
jgi:alkyl hydroperoxide reductase subunit AhpC